MILYQEIPPPQDIEYCIAAYWRFEYRPNSRIIRPLQHKVVPDGCVSLLFMAREGVPLRPPSLVYPTAAIRHVEAAPDVIYLGIRLRPGWARPILGIDPRQPVSSAPPVGDHLEGLDTSAIFRRLRSGLEDFQFLTPVITAFVEKRQPEADERIQNAVRCILEAGGNIRIEEAARQATMSMRQLQRRFKAEVGLTPKEFARVRRFRSALIQLLLEDKPRQDVLFEQGYFDPAHFNKDCFSIVGTAPNLFEAYISRIEHVGVK
ncbi:MAG: helix-turn-helix transcriptional regulator [Lewinellaceae bacterium]|nr:helix-turn-helix transcriptional regulator [Lewinellaceae bacterium]